MILTDQQQSILNGEHGVVLAKAMKTLVRYGEIFGATHMEPVTGNSGHLVVSFEAGTMKPVYKIADELIKGGLKSKQPFSVGPCSADSKIYNNILQKIRVWHTYSRQKKYARKLKKLGHISENAFSCTCYMNEVGNVPNKGDILSWADSSAVIYANSVLGARCNRNAAIIELFGSIVGFVPCFGLLTDQSRKATWVVEVKTTEMPEAQLLGMAISKKVKGEVPYIIGLEDWTGAILTQNARDFLKDMGGAAVAEGPMGLYHVDNLTPEAVEFGHELIVNNAKKYVIDDLELLRIKDEQAAQYKNTLKPKWCFVGCPHLSLVQLAEWTQKLSYSLKLAKRTKLAVPIVFSAAPGVIKKFSKTPDAARLKKMGCILSMTCPVVHINNSFFSPETAITNSQKISIYTSARYYTDDEIVGIVTREASL